MCAQSQTPQDTIRPTKTQIPTGSPCYAQRSQRATGWVCKSKSRSWQLRKWKQWCLASSSWLFWYANWSNSQGKVFPSMWSRFANQQKGTGPSDIIQLGIAFLSARFIHNLKLGFRTAGDFARRVDHVTECGQCQDQSCHGPRDSTARASGAKMRLDRYPIWAREIQKSRKPLSQQNA